VIRRSISFDKFSRGVKSIVSSSSEKENAPSAMPAKSKQLLFILLQRGPNGLGLELDATNTVVNLVPGGAASVQGYFREGDTIASVDGIPLRGRLLQDVMDRGKNSYSFDVWRLTPVEAEPEKTRSLNPVRRAFSFDRKKR
jgi:C-terminal processing protease CtpA/Prc